MTLCLPEKERKDLVVKATITTTYVSFPLYLLTFSFYFAICTRARKNAIDYLYILTFKLNTDVSHLTHSKSNQMFVVFSGYAT